MSNTRFIESNHQWHKEHRVIQESIDYAAREQGTSDKEKATYCKMLTIG